MAKVTENRMAWLVAGVFLGLAISYVWPHEPLQAVATDRNSQFAIVTGNVGLLDPVDAVFTLDFLTGQVRGACINRALGKFNVTYYRNVAQDFKVDPQTKPIYAICMGAASLQAKSGFTPAASLLYVAELTSGKVGAYTFPWQEYQQPVPPIQLTPIDSYQFRDAEK